MAVALWRTTAHHHGGLPARQRRVLHRLVGTSVVQPCLLSSMTEVNFKIISMNYLVWQYENQIHPPRVTEAETPSGEPIKYSLFPPLGLATLAGYCPIDESGDR